MSRLKLAAIGALLAGPFMLVMNFMETKEKEQIDKEGVETMAVVTEKTEERGRKGRRSYEFAVEYLDGASTRTANVDVSKERYDSIDAVPLLKIKYLQAKPQKVLVVGEKIGRPEFNYIGGALFAAGLAGCWWVFLRKKPEVLAAPVVGA